MPNGPDYSAVTSQAAVENLYRGGALQKLLLLPQIFGGSDIPPNVVYVPAFVIELKARIDANIVKPLVDEGKVTSYAAEPQYRGDSFVPSAIVITASNPTEFRTVIQIWGEASS